MTGHPTGYGIEIPRAGQHPYMPGAVRLSAILIILALWLVGVIVISQFITPTSRNVISAIIILCLFTGAIYTAGRMMAKSNPFHQEIVIRSVLRTLRNRTNLET